MDIKNFEPAMPSLKVDTSHLDSAMLAMTKASQERWEREERKLDALEATAKNTNETNNRLNKVIDNQNDYIEALKTQIEMQKRQNELSAEQVEILKNIFASGENGMTVERELIELIRKEIDDKHPLWDYVKDKGGDLVVAGITASAPVLYNAFKAYLLTKGILLP